MRKCAEMAYHHAVKLRIYPSSEQKHIIAVNDGASRFVYNRMTANDRELHSLKKTKLYCEAVEKRVDYLKTVSSSKKELYNTIPFLSGKEIDSNAVDNSVRNHIAAWKQFRKVPGTSIPGFHKKGYEQSYQTNAHYQKDATCWDDGNVSFFWKSPGEQVPHSIRLPKLGVIRFRCSDKVRNLLLTHRENTRVGTITIRRDNCGEYYAILQLSSDTPFVEKLPKTGAVVGIDMNLTNLYTDSDGNVVPNPKYGKHSKDRLAKAQKKLSRMAERAKKEGRSLRDSRNYQKQRLRTANIQRKVTRCRNDYLEVETKRLVESQDLIVSEDLKVKNLLKNHRLAYSIADVSWGKFFILLWQKAQMYGKTYLKVNPHYTTQTCSHCGHVMEGDEHIRLGVEEWTCPVCGTHHNRDHNSAKVILKRGLLLYNT